MQHIQLGIQGEDAVAHYLYRNGFTIVARNYRQRYGEIDVIACKNNVLVFVEVKTRSSSYMDPAEVITPTKQRKIIMTAHAFLSEYHYTDMVCQFDVALVDKNNNIQYIPHAFNEGY
ncbi:MAG TPA: YraN family protein [Candidatus Dependentiae bacterium]|nr:YraN family protein [Candidatus Dependentiae bacterium]HRQ62922.1 YraN family protein [Candidatus Dependentiae bacterium]